MRRLLRKLHLQRITRLQGRMRVMMWLSLSVMLVQLLPLAWLAVMWVVDGRPPEYISAIVAVEVAGMFAVAIGALVVRHRVRKAVRAADFRCCPWCLYDVSDLVRPDGRGRCPECGAAFTERLLVRIWSRSAMMGELPRKMPSSKP